ncbi:MAG: anthranilate phosphoribosyltransferase, partial [Pirellulales bacterium]
QVLREWVWSPADFGLPESSLDSIRVDGPQQSADMVRAVLEGAAGVARDIVVANAAAALWTAGKADDLRQCAELAAAAIDSRDASKLLTDLVQLTNR